MLHEFALYSRTTLFSMSSYVNMYDLVVLGFKLNNVLFPK